MSSRIARLIENYQRHIELPWQTGLAGVQKVIMKKPRNKRVDLIYQMKFK